MNRAKLDNYRAILNKEFAEIGKKHGLVLDFKNITYDDTSFRFTLNCLEDSSEAKQARQKEAINNILMYVSGADLERVACTEDEIRKNAFTQLLVDGVHGKTFMLEGFNRDRAKCVSIKEVSTGGLYSTSPDSFIKYFANGKKITKVATLTETPSPEFDKTV